MKSNLKRAIILTFLFMFPLIALSQSQTCPIDGGQMLYDGIEMGFGGQLTVYSCSNGHVSYQSDSNLNNSNNSMQDYINYLKEKDKKEAAATEFKKLNARAAKFGMSANPNSTFDNAFLRGYLNVVEAQARSQERERNNRIANEKYARELGYSSYAELVRARNKRREEERARKLYQKEMKRKKPVMEANLEMKSNRELFYFSDVAVKIALLRKNQSESPSSLSLKSLNEFKYVVLLESTINFPNIKKSLTKYWKNDLPELIIVENEKSIPEELKSNPNLAIYLDVSIEAFNEMFTKSNFYLYENNSNLFYSINQKRKSANKAIKLLVEEIQNNNYQFDENLVKPYISKKPVPEIKKITQDKIKAKEPVDKVKDGFQTMSKDDAVKEIKVLKELYDSEILTKDEYLKKAAELKKIILGN